MSLPERLHHSPQAAPTARLGQRAGLSARLRAAAHCLAHQSAEQKSDLFVDDVVKASVTLQNNETVTQNMVSVTLGIAPGFA